MSSIFRRFFHSCDKPRDAVSSAPTFYFGTSASGKAVNPSSAIQVSAVYACVRVIAETIASLPFHVFESTEDGSRKATEHPLYRIIHDEPNSEMTSFVWRETLLAHLLLYGNAYCQIIRTGRDKIAGIYPLLPDTMKVPVGTVKSWLHRVRGGKKDNCTPGICLRCGKRFPVVEGLKLKKFCSDSCRISWWSSNRERMNRKAEICSVCRVCGRTYMSYPSQGKIYCSRRCYFEDR